MLYHSAVLVLFIALSLGKMIPTPVGYHPEECVHDIPSGTHIQEDLVGGGATLKLPTGEQRRIEPCNATMAKRQFPADYDGWLAFTSFKNPTNQSFDDFLGYFSVPNKPARDPQVLFIFTGLQNVNWIPKVDPEPPVFDIIQPVLQYPGDFGNYWSFKSWYVTLGDNVLRSDERDVSVGDNVFGNMTRLGPDTWYVAGVSQETGKENHITVSHPRLTSQPWAYTTVEGYGVQGCDWEPTNDLKFTRMRLRAAEKIVVPQWDIFYSPDKKCNEKATVTNPLEVVYSFQ